MLVDELVTTFNKIRDTGTGVLIVEQHLNLVRRTTSSFVVMAKGEIIDRGRTEDIDGERRTGFCWPSRGRPAANPVVLRLPRFPRGAKMPTPTGCLERDLLDRPGLLNDIPNGVADHVPADGLAVRRVEDSAGP